MKKRDFNNVPVHHLDHWGNTYLEGNNNKKKQVKRWNNFLETKHSWDFQCLGKVWEHFAHHFVKRPHSYQSFKKVNQPLCLQYNGAAVLHDHSQVMIEIQHGHHFLLIIYFANFLRNREKLIKIHVIGSLSYQSFDDFFEVEPPTRRQK